MTTTTPSPSRRERLRSATVAEIKQTARHLLLTGGPAAVSLRAIARDMGMTAPAIYRYFPSLDALVTDLVTDVFDELRNAVEQVTDADPVARLTGMAREFRRWAVAHPGDFALVFGSPVPGVTQFDQHCIESTDGGARLGEVFLRALAAVYEQYPPPAPPAGVPSPEPVLGPYLQAHVDAFPPVVTFAFLGAWSRLYGLVAGEVFGHLRWAVTDVGPLFEAELAGMMASLTDSR